MGVASPAEAAQLRKVLLFLLIILTLFLYSRASLALEVSGITVAPPQCACPATASFLPAPPMLPPSSHKCRSQFPPSDDSQDKNNKDKGGSDEDDEGNEDDDNDHNEGSNDKDEEGDDDDDEGDNNDEEGNNNDKEGDNNHDKESNDNDDKEGNNNDHNKDSNNEDKEGDKDKDED